MFKINRSIIVAVLFGNLLFAQTTNEIEVYANSVVDHGNNAEITGGVVIEYKGDLLSAKSAKYDKANNRLILNDSVTIIGKSGKRINAKELTVNLDNDHIKFKDFFEIDKEDIWISSTKAKQEENIYNLQNALFSSCDVNNPDWMVGFDKAVYDTKTKMLKLSDAKVYIKDIPVFYFPYIPLYLGKERKTGLLRPVWGNINDEGYLYEQPFFWAISKSQDLEINPQIRTKRGSGLYLTYRFVHAKDAKGTIKAGYFKDKLSYTNKYNLKYKKHYGVEIDYTNGSVIDSLSTDGYENKLYLNGIYFSDGDYVGLQINRLNHYKIGSYYDSRANYFIRNNYFYSGIGFRYFKSDNSVNNDNTIQILPNLHFHIPYTNILFNNLSYSADLAVTNYTRKEGTKALRVKLKAPLEMHFSMFNNYLNLNIAEEIESSGYDFYNVPIDQKKYSSIVMNHKIELASELTKVYDSGIHTMLNSVTFTKSSLMSDEWMKYSEIPQNLKNDFIDDIPFASKLTFRTHQFWQSFAKKGLNIDYILEAHYYFKEHKLRDLTQEFSIDYKNWSIYSQIGYSFLHKKTTGIYNKLGYDNNKYGLFLSYLWKKDYLSLETVSKDLGVDGYYNFNDNLKLRASASYDLKNKNLKNWEIGSNYNKHCWDLDISFGEDIRPVIKSDGSRGSISNNYIKAQITILPFGFSYSAAK